MITMQCLLHKTQIFKNNQLNVNALMDNVAESLNINSTNRHYKHLRKLLDMCAGVNPNFALECLRNNTQRFGLRKFIEFDPSMKIPLYLGDLLIPFEHQQEVLRGCYGNTKYILYEMRDLLVCLCIFGLSNLETKIQTPKNPIDTQNFFLHFNE